MSNLFKIKNHIQAIMTALDNHEHGRMPLNYFEDVFEGRVETVRDLIHAEYRNKKEAAE